ncbi:MAG: DUF2723 domain-containing protein [Kiritimatiellae bacterium]|nr:DUF2723 domain-containing protein [Kiritimatiellia bacterium]
MKERFFTRLDWAAFWTATLITFVVYFLTLGPSVGLEDSGELATAAANLGVPHPPGYPFWTFCSWLFCKAFSWVTYMGHPTPAWATSLCSAVFGAFAAGCTAMLICRSSRDFIGLTTDGDSGVPEPLPMEGCGKWLSFGGGVAGALTFALSPVEWSQSTIVEIYSLNALFLMWVFLLSYRWMRRPTDKMLWFTAFVFGLGLTNYQVLLFAIVPLALVILMRNVGLFRDVFIYMVPVGMTWQVLQIGQLMRADASMQADVINKHAALVGSAVTTPSTTVLVLAVAALVVSIVAAVVLKGRGEPEKAEKALLYGGGGGAALMLLASFVFVSKNTWSGITAPVAPLIEPTRYALIAALVAGSVVAAMLAALRGDERLADPKSMKLVCISAGFAVAAIAVAALVHSAGDAGYAGKPFPWGKSTFMFWLLVAVLFALASFTKKGLCFAIPVAGLHIAVFTLLRHGAMNGLTHPQSWWFWWGIAWNFVLLAMAWLSLPNGRSVAGAAFFAQLGVSFYVYMPIVSDLRNPPMNWGYPRTWEGFKHAIMRGQYEAIGFQKPTWGQILNYFEDVRVQFTDLLIPFAIVPFAAGHWIVKKENRKAFWQWMVPALVCFLLMSILLIALANVKGDLQDGFIQKVKFISSHAMLAMWIGYGLVFAAFFALRWFVPRIGGARLNTAAIAAAALMIVVSLVYPIVDNYCGNYRLGVNEVAFKLGGNEQNGHTFGWQFGAYQLEGAKAIKEQIVADEEPLPDPDWPEPMEPFSIFFGGTDPGRFVPTYMIYSAMFRPDVYLITQNALADDTYMSVERDLYGDEIWIPSKEDSAEAFNVYVDEVQRGVRPANGDLKIENGRVQVTGALGVMEINGILTKMMHDHDRLRHSFYVEESYVIQWMYPYLSPHGLIMKINAEQTPYDAKTAAKDMDFWDWYSRRLLDDPMYRRDFAGQKSFSKLRAAIAGLYQRQGRFREASQAFREACLLYPASPEATFRYAQECLLPFRRWDVVLDMMAYTDLIDPNNRRTEGLKNYVVRIRSLTEEIARIEAKRRESGGKLEDADALSLVRCYSEVGRIREAAQLLHGLADKLSDAASLIFAARLFMEARMDADAENALNRYLKLKPMEDANAWADLAKLQHRTGRRQAAQQSFIQGYRIDAQGLFNRLQKDQELYEIAAPLFRRK